MSIWSSFCTFDDARHDVGYSLDDGKADAFFDVAHADSWMRGLRFLIMEGEFSLENRPAEAECVLDERQVRELVAKLNLWLTA